MLAGDHLCLDLDDGSQALFVPWHDVDGGGSPSNLRAALGTTRDVHQLRRWLGGLGHECCDLDDENLVDAAARMLEQRGYVFVRLRRTFGGGGPRPASAKRADPRSTAPMLSELAEKRPTTRTATLSIELVEDGGAPHAGAELTLVHCDARRDRIVLDDAGRWSGRDVPLPGPTRIEFPRELPRLEGAPVDGFESMLGDIAVARRPNGHALLQRLDAHYRLVVAKERHAVTEVVLDGYAQGASVMRWGGMRERSDATVATARAALRVALWAARGKQLAVAGHADPLGQDMDNDVLSLARATSLHLFAVGDLYAWAEHAAANASELDLACALVACHRILGLGPAGIDDAPRLETALAAVRMGRGLPSEGPTTVDDWFGFAELYELDLARFMMTDRAGLAEIRASIEWIDTPAVALGESFPLAIAERIDVVGPPALAHRRCALLVFGPEDEGPAAMSSGARPVYDGSYDRTTLRVPGEVLVDIEVSRVKRDAIARGRAWISCGDLGASEHIAGDDGHVRFMTLAGDTIEVVAAFDAGGRGTMVAAGTESI